MMLQLSELFEVELTAVRAVAVYRFVTAVYKTEVCRKRTGKTG